MSIPESLSRLFASICPFSTSYLHPEHEGSCLQFKYGEVHGRVVCCVCSVFSVQIDFVRCLSKWPSLCPRKGRQVIFLMFVSDEIQFKERRQPLTENG